MGEPTCLMQVQPHEQQHHPFSFPSVFPNTDSNEGSNTMHALGQSISFGRFVSESLEWEKWSTFSHNRYVEEAERYSKPGSVAQKKAFFEAHYKNLAARKKAEAEAAAAAAAAAAEAEAAAVAAEVIEKSEEENAGRLELNCGGEEQKFDSNVEMVQIEAMKVEKSNSKRDNNDQVMVQVNTTKKKKPNLTSSSSKNSSSSLSSSTTKSGAPLLSSKLSTKSSASNVTPMCKKPLLESGDKKGPTPKSLHMGVNFSPIREISRLKSTVIRKIDNSRFGSNSSSKTTKDCHTPLKTPIKVPKNGSRQHPSETPLSSNRRVTTPINPSAYLRKQTGPNWRSLATDCSKFLSACRNKTRSPSSTPFSFRTEERAAKRKEKLEEKFNLNEPLEEEQPNTKVKDKPETENGKFTSNLCFKARPLPDFYKLRKVQKEEATKVLVTRPQSPKPGKTKATPGKVEPKGSQTPNRTSVKSSSNGSKHLQGKSARIAACALISRPKRTTTITHENTSPNIQYGRNK